MTTTTKADIERLAATANLLADDLATAAANFPASGPGPNPPEPGPEPEPDDDDVDLFVGPNGSDANNGETRDKAMKTLKAAYNKAQSGETIGVMAGTYRENTLQFNKQDIVIKSVDATPAKFDGSNVSTGYPPSQGAQFVLTGGKTHLLNIEVTKAPEFGIVVQGGDGNIVERMNVHHIGPGTKKEAKGIFLTGNAKNTLFLNNDSHENANDDGKNADGFQLATTGTGTVMRGNRSWGNSDDGIDLFMVQDNKNAGAVLLEDNWSFDNGLKPGTRDQWGDGAGFKLGGTRGGTSGKSGGHTLKRNYAWGNAVYGFSSNGNQLVNTLTDCYTALTGNSKDSTRYGWYDMGSGDAKNTNCAAYGPLQEQMQPDPCPGVTRKTSTAWNAAGATGPRGPNGELPDVKFF